MSGIIVKFAEEHRPIESITIDAQTAAELLDQLEVLDTYWDGDWSPNLGNLVKVLRRHRKSLPLDK